MRAHYVRAADLREGDYVDLEGDKIADPKGDKIMFQSEFALVASVENETPACVAVGIEGVDVFGFPPDHMIKMAGDLAATPEWLDVRKNARALLLEINQQRGKRIDGGTILDPLHPICIFAEHLQKALDAESK